MPFGLTRRNKKKQRSVINYGSITFSVGSCPYSADTVPAKRSELLRGQKSPNMPEKFKIERSRQM